MIFSPFLHFRRDREISPLTDFLDCFFHFSLPCYVLLPPLPECPAFLPAFTQQITRQPQTEFHDRLAVSDSEHVEQSRHIDAADGTAFS